MSVATQPSVVKAFIELLRGNATRVHPSVATLVTSLQTLASTRIDTDWQTAWDKPDGRIYNAITVQSDGGLGTQVERIGVRSQGRVLIRCWSTTYHVANQMMQLLQQIVDPIDPAWSGWVAANTRVDSLTGISEALQFQDPEREYRRAMQATANAWYRRTPVAA